MDNRPIIGIDLGTTNSVAALYQRNAVVIVEEEGDSLLPSCVSISPPGEALVGHAARNQAVLYPERTVLSIKRKMGSPERVVLGDQRFSPQEISALILRTVAKRAAQQLGAPVDRAVITVPAYFSDAQRQATREAGKLAGLEVVRLLNEPTAAALAYGGETASRTVMVYDLGGGTFDVSIVRIDGDITEVLSSHGDTQLGGDDLDSLLLQYAAERFMERHRVDPRTDVRATARLRRAVEEARCRLSSETHVMLREEGLITQGKIPLHLELELTREQFEVLARPLLLRTLDSVHRALRDAHVPAQQLDAVLLAGGATRTPLVMQLLTEQLGRAPRRDLHPDLCVAQGAALLAGRLQGQDSARILLDISPYAYGPAHLGERHGQLYPYCYTPVIPRNTPLPTRRTESYYTSVDNQTGWSVQIFQGDNPDALQNILIGHFLADGFSKAPAGSEILCQMDLDPDGILHVTAIEASTGLKKAVTIENAMATLEGDALDQVRRRLQALVVDPSELSSFEAQEETDDFEDDLEESDGDEADDEADDGADDGADEITTWAARREDSATHEQIDTRADRERAGPAGPAHLRGRFAAARALVERSQGALQRMHQDDQADALGLIAQLELSLETEDLDALDRVTGELSDLLFYVETR